MTLEDCLLRVQAAEQGLGLAMVPRSVADHALATQRLCTLPQFPTSPLPARWLSKSRLAPRTPAADTVFDWLVAKVR